MVTNATEGVLGGTSPVRRRQLRADLIRRLAGRPIAGSPELAALVRAHSEHSDRKFECRNIIRNPAGHEPDRQPSKPRDRLHV